MTLYEYFSCNTKEELYERIKSGDATVKSLIDFIEFSKGTREINYTSISSPEDFVHFFNSTNFDKDLKTDKAIGLFVSSKNEPIHLTRIEVTSEKQLKSVLRESLNVGAVSAFFLFHHNESLSTIKMVEDYFETFGISVYDTFNYDSEQNKIYSHAAGMSYRMAALNAVSESELNYFQQKREEEIYKLKGFEEFATYFAEKEIIGQNIFKNNFKIKENLKVGYQYDNQETFGLIICDEKGDVLFVNELFRGGTSSAVVDQKVVAKELLSIENAKYAIVFHNHPSGFPEPSQEDIGVTNGIKNICEKLDMKLLDHYIIGKRRVYSFAEERELFVSEDKKYRQALKRDKEQLTKVKSRELER